MSALNRTIVAFALVVMKLTICDAFTVNGRRPQEPKPPYPYDAEEVVFENEKHGVRLAGTLTLPLAKGPFPAVLLCTETGPQDRDGTVFGSFSRNFASTSHPFIPGSMTSSRIRS